MIGRMQIIVMKKKILVIDDEQMILDTISLVLEDLGYEVTVHQDTARGEDEAKKKDFDLIILDLQMPQKTGDQVTESILKSKPGASILILTGHPTEPLAQKALDAGAKSLLKKPFELEKILSYLG